MHELKSRLYETIMKPKFVSLEDLSSELKIRKSKLNYYYNLGLLVPEFKLNASRTLVFEHSKVIKQIRTIEKLKKLKVNNRHINLKEIKSKLNENSLRKN